MKKRPLPNAYANECAVLKALYITKRKEAGLTQAEIADALGISQAAVSHYLNGENPLNTRVAAVFAQKLGVPVQAFSPRLAREIEQITEAANIGAGLSRDANVQYIGQPKISFSYPVLSWVAAGSWAVANEPYPPGFSDRYELSDYEAKGAAFWLEVKGDSMTSPVGLSIPEGMLILIDTEEDARHGKLVVAKLTDSNEATFKKLVEDSGQRFLKPLNPSYPMLAINGNCKIIGVVVRALMKL
ncbi:LexA family transcriptional regulator [Pseudomonas putida]|uniref:LexA family protein n=1 Tax=Pseudomonas putida TaxID=303 RepID=UPI001A8DDDA1|nr:LexA family transcriptional regulator [Pseudomonas putida]MBO0369259.1 LexA family transcriptional regulator [Pseudomonas putida]